MFRVMPSAHAGTIAADQHLLAVLMGAKDSHNEDSWNTELIRATGTARAPLIVAVHRLAARTDLANMPLLLQRLTDAREADPSLVRVTQEISAGIAARSTLCLLKSCLLDWLRLGNHSTPGDWFVSAGLQVDAPLGSPGSVEDGSFKVAHAVTSLNGLAWAARLAALLAAASARLLRIVPASASNSSGSQKRMFGAMGNSCEQ
jgi:hypothetical protein